jgi:hypothetical protein
MRNEVSRTVGSAGIGGIVCSRGFGLTSLTGAVEGASILASILGFTGRADMICSRVCLRAAPHEVV